MKTLTIKIYNNKDELIMDTNSPSAAFLCAAMYDFHKFPTRSDLSTAVNLAHEMYLKDGNHTPLGHLADYVGKHYKRLSNLSMLGALMDFYENFESEEYND